MVGRTDTDNSALLQGEALDETWKGFKESGDPTLRNRLIERYLYLVKVIGNRIAGRLPRSIDVQDLRSEGVFGLIQAIENFDITRGTRFESYAATRIHGAILDELRAQDWVPRLVRASASKYRKALGALRETLGRDPSTREVAEYTGSTDVEAEDLRRESNMTTVFTLAREDENSEDPHQVRKLDVLVDRDSALPMEQLEDYEIIRVLVKELSLPEQTVSNLYYNDGLTMKEIGTVMRVSESRVCQIHTRLLKRLKLAMDEALANAKKPGQKPVKAVRGARIPRPERLAPLKRPEPAQSEPEPALQEIFAGPPEEPPEKFIAENWSSELGTTQSIRAWALAEMMREQGRSVPEHAALKAMVAAHEKTLAKSS